MLLNRSHERAHIRARSVCGRNGKAAADIQKKKRKPRRQRLIENFPHEDECVLISLGRKRLTPHVEAHTNRTQPCLFRCQEERYRRLRLRPEFSIEIDQRPLILHAHAHQHLGARHGSRHLGNFAFVVEGKSPHAELRRRRQPLRRLDRIRVDHARPGKPHARQRLDLASRSRIKRRAPLCQSCNDTRRGIRLHGVIYVHPRHISLQEIIISLDLRQRNDDKRRRIFLRQLLHLFFREAKALHNTLLFSVKMMSDLFPLITDTLGEF